MSELNKKKLVVILPTYNEAGSIARILDALFRIELPAYLQVLVFDSNSTDNTAHIVKAKQTMYPTKLHLLQEPKKTGLGSAYYQAMHYALDALQADYIVECDADGSHPVYALAQMFEHCGQKRVVVGSRFVQQSGADLRKNYARRALTTLARLCVNLLLKSPIADVSSGFRITHRSDLHAVLNKPFFTSGFSYKYELLQRLANHGCDFVEYPIQFQNRLAGKSKLSKNCIPETIKTLLYLRFTRDGAGL